MMTINNDGAKKCLIDIIYQKRKQMLKVAEIYGLGSKNTLEYSQELDEMIVKYQLIERN